MAVINLEDIRRIANREPDSQAQVPDSLYTVSIPWFMSNASEIPVFIDISPVLYLERLNLSIPDNINKRGITRLKYFSEVYRCFKTFIERSDKWHYHHDCIHGNRMIGFKKDGCIVILCCGDIVNVET